MSEIQRLPTINNPIHPNAKATTQINNGTTTTKSNISSPVCRNCKTQTTPLWRRDETGQVLCNACGLFLKLHGRARPISLKTDTIKLRNRIKQPNFNKSLGPNTPELKLKDVKNPSKDSPKPKKKSGNNSPMEGIYSSGSLKPLPLPGPSLGIQSPLQHNPTRIHYPGSTNLSQHLGRLPGTFPAQVQLLNYPSSTPTQFAPGLQRITSPLLLSTTLSMLNARSTPQTSSSAVNIKTIGAMGGLNGSAPHDHGQGALTDAQAAGALENMSNELGPSASFKGGVVGANGTSLIAPTGRKPHMESAGLSTPSSALSQNGHVPKFPALASSGRDSRQGNVIVSPSFGPQFHLQDTMVKAEPLDHPKPSLPPISSLTSRSPPGSLPQLTAASSVSSVPATPENGSIYGGKDQVGMVQNKPIENVLSAAASQGYSAPRMVSHSDSTGSSGSSGYPAAPGNNLSNQSGEQPPNSMKAGREGGVDPNNGNTGNNGNNGNNPNNNPNNNGGANSNYQFSLLKTRISELELVNDLYRTRIMELEAMEQAARLREQSMRKRLDEFLMEQGQAGSASVLSDTMKILKREGDANDDTAKRQKQL